MIRLKRVVCIGDSNTYGYDPRSYFGGEYPENVRWTGRLTGWDVVNYGENGAEIPTREWEWETHERRIRQALPITAAIVMLGSNDLLQHPNFTAEQVAERMEIYLQRIIRHISPGQILLLAPVPMRPGTWVNESRLPDESAHLGECYETLSKRIGVGFADTSLWNVELSFDGVHLTPNGHRVFAEKLRELLENRFT